MTGRRFLLLLSMPFILLPAGLAGEPQSPPARPAGAPGPRTPDRGNPTALPREVVATVNGRPITLKAVTRKLLGRYGRAALQVLMVDEVLAEAAAEAGVSVTDEEVAHRIAEAEQREGGRDGLLRRLAEQDVTLSQFREDLRRELLIEKLLQAQGRLTVTEEDIRDAYQRRYGERLELAMILLPTEEEAREVERLLAQGAEFGRLARERSRDPLSAAACGRLGQVVRADLLPELQEPVFSLKVGEVSRPLLTRYGYHIFKVLERLPAQEVPLEEVRGELVREARQRKLAAERSALVSELLRRADIAVNERDHPWVRPPKAPGGP